MNEKELFRAALGLSPPWFVARIEFSEESRRLDIHLDFPKGSLFACPVCGKPSSVHDTSERTWRHLNFFQHETYLHARQPRVDCDEHKVRTAEVPWSRPGAGFTLLFEALVMMLAGGGMTPNAIGRQVGEHDTLIWRILRHYVDEARARMDASEVRAVGVDETSRAKGHRYVTVFMDLKKPRVLFVTEGKGASTVREFKMDLAAHGGRPEGVSEFCLDLSPAFQSGIKTNFPDSHMTFDPFHLTKIVNEAVDEVRRREVAERPELMGTRYVWLKNEWNHTAKQRDIFQALRGSTLKTARAYQLKSVFQDLFACRDLEQGEGFLKRWYFWATHSRLEPMIKAAKTIKRHWDGVIRWFESEVSNGLLEGMNSLIQAAKTRARGYRNVQNFITTIYLIGSKLEFNLPSPVPVTHTK